jgi:hypothetical protein
MTAKQKVAMQVELAVTLVDSSTSRAVQIFTRFVTTKSLIYSTLAMAPKI